MGRPCRNLTVAERRCRHAGCGACVGPFPFAAGFLVILSTPLAATLARSPGLRSDLAALRAVSQLVSRQGRKQGKLMEDILYWNLSETMFLYLYGFCSVWLLMLWLFVPPIKNCEKG